VTDVSSSRGATSAPKVVMSGMVAGDPHQGGATWAVLQYVLGLGSLGCDVTLVEQWEPPRQGSLARTATAAYFREIVSAFGLEERSALLRTGARETVGLGYSRLREACAEADLLVNVSGLLTDPNLIEAIPIRVYLDLDPAFNQLWHASGIDMRFGAHNRFVTVGQAIGTPASPVPDCGLDWIPTVPPIVLEEWPVANGPGDAFTTIGNWRGYGSVEQDGVHYGQRVHSMRPLMSLPRLTEAKLRLALAIHPDEKPDLEALDANGWTLVSPVEAAGTPEAYRRFIQQSRGELGIAKSGYVLSRSGWFSDRSAAYLASGRPVVAQETGFTSFLPTGEGLLAFETVEEAAAALDEVESDYARHADAARELAVEHFDSNKVLARLLEKVEART
jgi:hypothetical protein